MRNKTNAELIQLYLDGHYEVRTPGNKAFRAQISSNLIHRCFDNKLSKEERLWVSAITLVDCAHDLTFCELQTNFLLKYYKVLECRQYTKDLKKCKNELKIRLICGDIELRYRMELLIDLF